MFSAIEGARLVKVVVHVKSCIHATDINSESVRFKSYYSSHLHYNGTDLYGLSKFMTHLTDI